MFQRQKFVDFLPNGRTAHARIEYTNGIVFFHIVNVANMFKMAHKKTARRSGQFLNFFEERITFPILFLHRPLGLFHRQELRRYLRLSLAHIDILVLLQPFEWYFGPFQELA